MQTRHLVQPRRDGGLVGRTRGVRPRVVTRPRDHHREQPLGGERRGVTRQAVGPPGMVAQKTSDQFMVSHFNVRSSKRTVSGLVGYFTVRSHTSRGPRCRWDTARASPRAASPPCARWRAPAPAPPPRPRPSP
jgi:hypothetical protein